MVGCSHCAEWEARYHALVVELIGLKREGFAPSDTPMVAAPLRELPPVVQEAVLKWSAGGPSVISDQTKLAWLLLEQNQSPEQVAATIGDGQELPL